MDDVDISMSSIFGNSFVAIADDKCSTPKRKPKKQELVFKAPGPVVKRKVTAAAAKVLKRVKQKQKEKLGCHVCGKEYVSLSSFKNHIRGHAIDLAAEKYPDGEKIMSSLSEITKHSLGKVIESAPYGDVSECASRYLEMLGQTGSFEEFTETIGSRFVNGLVMKKFVLPSKLLECIVKETETILSDIELRQELLVLLSFLSESNADEDVMQLFLCEFVLCFGEELLRFISKCLQEANTFRMRPPHECDAYDRKVIHYIGGAILRGFYKRAKQFATSSIWKSIKTAIVENMIENEHVTSPSVEDKSWTEDRDKGKLLKISDDCLEYFVCLAEIIEVSEESDGSISYLAVYEKVCNSMAMTVYWDNMISDSLPENVSLILMKALVKSFCQTYGRGISRRRLHAGNDAPVTSINLRHQVARKVK